MTSSAGQEPFDPSSNRGMHRHADHSSGERLPAGLARDLAELARELQASEDMDGLLDRIAYTAVHEVEAADWACISEIDRRGVQIRAATNPIVERVDKLQMEINDGPCLTSLRDEITVRASDLATDTRWPAFGPAAVAAGVRSMLSVQLFVVGDNLGALNLYSTQANAFDDGAETIAILLAAHAAVAMKGTKMESNLRTAVASRDIIGQAKGVLVERYKVSSQTAFDMLVLVSQRTHRKLRDVSEDLVMTGEFEFG